MRPSCCGDNGGAGASPMDEPQWSRPHEPEWYCPATARTTGERCKRRAGAGTEHQGTGACWFHFGRTETHKKAALQAQAAKELRKLLPAAKPVTNPLLALQQLAGRATAWSELLEDKVASLSEWRYEDDKGGEQLRSEVALFERAMSECRQVLTACGRLKIEERQAALDERVAEAVVAVIVGTLADLKLDAAVRAQAVEIAEKRLLALEV